MKPFELTVYPPLTDTEKMSVSLTLSTGLNVWHTPPPGFLESKRKRLTPAELAAEAWRGEADLGIGKTNARFGYFKKPNEAQWEADLLLHSLDELTHRLEALTRFATLPHYDEQDQP